MRVGISKVSRLRKYFQSSSKRTLALVSVGVIIVASIGSIVIALKPTPVHANVAIPTTPVIQNLCGIRKASDIHQYSGTPLPSTGNSTFGNARADSDVISNFGNPTNSNPPTSGFFRYWSKTGQNSRWYVMNKASNTGATFVVYDATTNSPTPINSFSVTLPASQIGGGGTVVSTFALDPAGNIYLGYYADARNLGNVSQWFYPTGGATAATEGWASETTGLINGGIYSYTDANSVYRIGAVIGSSNISNTFNASTGASMSNNNVIGNTINVSSAHNNDIVSADTNNGQYVRLYDSTGMTQKIYFGTNLSPGSKPWSFYQLQSANEDTSGNIVVNDSGYGLLYFDSQGMFITKVVDDAGEKHIGPMLDPYVNGNLEIVGGNYYYEEGPLFSGKANLATLAGSFMQAEIAAPQVDVPLGIGAGLVFSESPVNTSTLADATVHYVPNGGTPSAAVEFYPWWSSVLSGVNNYSIQYTVETAEQVYQNITITPSVISLSNLASQFTTSGSTPLKFNIPLPAATPGFYQLNAKLFSGTTPIGADCMDYSIGMSGNTFDKSLTSTGGTTGAVEYAHEFGQKLVRSSFDISSNCLPGVDTSTVLTTATKLSCDSTVLADLQSAATLATADGVTLEIQIFGNSTGVDHNIVTGMTTPSNHLVLNSLVKQLVTALPEIHNWESYNEMNNTYSSDPQVLMTDIIAPTYNAIKSVRPTDNSVLGGILEPRGGPGGIIDGLARATALDNNGVSQSGTHFADTLGIHSYVGNGSSWEEVGYSSEIQKFKVSFPGIPIWDTESGYWENSQHNLFSQADLTIRKLILESSYGIPNVANYSNEINDVSSGYNYTFLDEKGLNPGGLASVTYKNMTGALTLNTTPLKTNIPHTYAFQYNAANGSSVIAAWSDSYNAPATVSTSSASIAINDEFGVASTVNNGGQVILTGQVQYLSVPSGVSFSLAPKESYGTNIASGSISGVVASDGTTTAAGSTTACNSNPISSGNGTPSSAIDSISDDQGNGDGGPCSESTWDPITSDPNPHLDIKLASAQSVDRVYVSGQDSGSVLNQLRGYDVSVSKDNGTSWAVVGSVRDQFFQRNQLVSFATTQTDVTNIRISNFTLDYSGWGDGLPLFFYGTPVDPNQVSIYTVEVYAPGTVTAQSNLPLVSLSTPGTGFIHANTALSAATTDQSGTGINRVEYYLNGTTLIGSSTTAPLYSVNWSTLGLQNGKNTITAKTYDNNSGSAMSTPVNVIVNNGDIDNNGYVNLADLQILAINYGTLGSYSKGDLNVDGTVNLPDLSILAINYGWVSP